MSSETVKHTPGPWRAIKAPHGPIDIFDERDHDVVTVFGSVADPARQQANARLIAAAPELLEAARLVAASAWESHSDDGPIFCVDTEAFASLEASVAKALGGSHDKE